MHDPAAFLRLADGTALFVAAKAMQDALSFLKNDGTPRAAAGRLMPYADCSAAVELSRFQELDHRFG